MQGLEEWRVEQAGPSSSAKLLLYGIVLAVSWGPRIRLDQLPGQNVDIRLQDLLLVLALVYLALSPLPPVRARWDKVWGKWLPAFLYVASLTTIVHMMVDQEVSDLVRVAFFGRTVEMFILAIAVCGLYLRAGIGVHEIGRVLRVGIWANLAWIAYQSVTGNHVTLFGEVGQLAESYGPKLIGEPSPFGTGIFLMFAAAVTVADYRTGTIRRPFAILTLLALLASAYLVQSRVSLVVIGVLVVFLSRHRLRSAINAPLLTFLGLGGLAALIAWGDQLIGRLSFEGLTSGIQVRADIWSLMADYAGDRFLIGVGPGGLTASGLEWDEAHNIIVRAWLDFGVLGAILLFATLLRIGRAALNAINPDQPTTLQWSGALAGLTLLGVLIAGMVQDALTAVMPTHLLMIATGILAAEVSKAAAARLEPAPAEGATRTR